MKTTPSILLVLALVLGLARAQTAGSPAGGFLRATQVTQWVTNWNVGPDGTGMVFFSYPVNAVLADMLDNPDVSAFGIANGLSTASNNGAMFGPDSINPATGRRTTTCGLQEWWNWKTSFDTNCFDTRAGVFTNAAGGLGRLGAGWFHLTSPLTFTNGFFNDGNGHLTVIPVSPYLKGEGKNITVICQDSPDPVPTIQTSYTNDIASGDSITPTEAFNLRLEDLAVTRSHYSSNISDRVDMVLLGNGNSFDINNCAFVTGDAWNGAGLGNSGGAALQGSDLLNAGSSGITLIHILSHNDNGIDIHDCLFEGGAWGAVLENDHGDFYNNTLCSCGRVRGVWHPAFPYPTNDVRCVGGAILLLSSGDMRIADNHFFHDGPCIVEPNQLIYYPTNYGANYGGPNNYGPNIIEGNMYEDSTVFFVTDDLKPTLVFNNRSGTQFTHSAGILTNRPSGWAVILRDQPTNFVEERGESGRLVTKRGDVLGGITSAGNLIGQMVYATNGVATYATNYNTFSSVASWTNTNADNVQVVITAGTDVSMVNAKGKTVVPPIATPALPFSVVLPPRAQVTGTALAGSWYGL